MLSCYILFLACVVFEMKFNENLFHSWRLEYDDLLVDAVRCNAKEAIKLLLSFSSNKLVTLKTIAPKGLVIAAQTGNLELIELFTESGYTIADAHEVECECEVCVNDRLGQSKERIERLRAQINPVWILKTSTNPLMTALKLWNTSKQLAITDDSFEKAYTDLAMVLKNFCLELLDEVNNEPEVDCIMNCGKTKDLSKLSFINMAIEMDHKEVLLIVMFNLFNFFNLCRFTCKTVNL